VTSSKHCLLYQSFHNQAKTTSPNSIRLTTQTMTSSNKLLSPHDALKLSAVEQPNRKTSSSNITQNSRSKSHINLNPHLWKIALREHRQPFSELLDQAETFGRQRREVLKRSSFIANESASAGINTDDLGGQHHGDTDANRCVPTTLESNSGLSEFAQELRDLTFRVIPLLLHGYGANRDDILKIIANSKNKIRLFVSSTFTG
jgi:hypothetical protein